MGFAAVGLFLICLSVYGFCRMHRIGATLPVIAVAALLLQFGAVHAAQVPGLAQAEDAKNGLRAWSEEQQAKAREAVAVLRQNQAIYDATLEQR